MEDFILNSGMDFRLPNTGIGSIIDMRRDANMTRNNARDQYEADVADFKDSLASDLENSFMSSGSSFVDSPVLDEFPRGIDDNFYDNILDDEPIYVPPTDIFDENIFNPPPPTPPMDDLLPPPRPPMDDLLPPPRPPMDDLLPPPTPPVDDFQPFTPPVDDFPPFTPPIDIPRPPIDIPRPPIDVPPRDRPPGGGRDRGGPPGGGRDRGGPPYIPPDEPPYIPPDEPPYIPPPPPPSDSRRPFYRPTRNYDSGVPAIAARISPASFGMAPGMFPPGPPKPIFKPPIVPPSRPPRVPPPDDFPFKLEGLKFGGSLNAGIMRLPQSQQGDTMTTQIFQRGFRPRR
jgi:hypothetical protein